jgi:hypothetical protein
MAIELVEGDLGMNTITSPKSMHPNSHLLSHENLDLSDRDNQNMDIIKEDGEQESEEEASQ